MGSGGWPRLQAALAHAFAVEGGRPAFAPEDEALLDRLAAAIVRRGLAAPALLFLEAFAPLNFLGSQALHAIAPLLDLAGSGADAERLAAILERREAVESLRARLEAGADRTSGPGREGPPGSGSAPPAGRGEA